MLSSARTRRRRSIPGSGIAVLVVAASLGLAACGGDDDDEDESAATTAPTEETTAAGGGGGETVDLTATDYKFNPDDPTVKAGEVTFKMTNDGETVHNVEIEGPNGEAEIEGDVQPGDSGEVTADLSEPGKYEFYCPVDDHKGLGMVGEVTVQG
jgi:uncharacterized cupredoxin-like copper-binding protein